MAVIWAADWARTAAASVDALQHAPATTSMIVIGRRLSVPQAADVAASAAADGGS